MNINLSISGLEKLADYFASGIGSTAGFFFSRMAARRDAEAKLIAAKGEVQAKKALAEGQATTMQIVAQAQADARSNLVSPETEVQGEITLEESITQRIQFQEYKRQANIEAVVRRAAEELGEKQVQDHDVDHDWTARFFSDVQDVSSEEMQVLWGRVLAGEVERPGNTSIRTLGILKNLDRTAAQLFKILCSLCISVRLSHIPFTEARVISLGGDAGNNALKEFGLDFGALNLLNEHGLIISDYNSWRDYSWAVRGASLIGSNPPQRLRIPFRFQGRYWLLNPVSPNSRRAEYKFHGAALTRSGLELLDVVDVDPVDSYAKALNRFFQKTNLEVTEVPSGEPFVIDSDQT